DGLIGIRVRLALIPDHALDREGQHRVDHLVVQEGRDLILFGLEVHACDPDAELPVAGERSPTAAHLDVEQIGCARDAASARGILHADGDDVRPRVQGLGRHLVHAGPIPRLLHPADAMPVHEANVGIVDHAETQRDGSRRLRLAQLEARAVPRDAIQPLVADLLPPARYGDRAPSRIIQLGIGPDGAAALHTGVRGGQLAADALAQRRAELLLAVALPLHDLTVGVLVEAQRLRAHPRLDAAAAPGALDDADGHVDVFAQLAREEESDGRE